MAIATVRLGSSVTLYDIHLVCDNVVYAKRCVVVAALETICDDLLQAQMLKAAEKQRAAAEKKKKKNVGRGKGPAEDRAMKEKGGAKMVSVVDGRGAEEEEENDEGGGVRMKRNSGSRAIAERWKHFLETGKKAELTAALAVLGKEKHIAYTVCIRVRQLASQPTSNPGKQ